MHDLIRRTLEWLMPSNGKRRAPAEGLPTAYPIEAADVPTTTLRTVGVVRPARSPRPPEFLRGEDTPLIRPYLIAHEQTHGIYHQEAAA